MLKTTFTGKGRVGLLLCLTGLLAFGTATTTRADDESAADQNNALRADYDTRPGDGVGDQSGAIADQGSPNDQDPPSRVARLSYMDGSVSMQPGGSGDWGTAERNRPVTIGDKIWVDKDARAELQAGQASIHLGAMTALSFLNLDQNITQMRLAEGSLNFRVRELREGDTYEVDTPNAAFTVRQAGAFRIDVNENGDGTIVTVLRGEGEVTSGGKSYDVHGGELAEFNGSESNVEYHSDRAPEADDFDRWAAQRDRKEEDSVSARYVSRDTVGYSDLDDNGTWNDEPGYGHVWYPNQVDVGWAPYSYGSWNYVGPWGWTWVDYSPWGFAPFHYGRWNSFGGRWGWCPGPIGVYPVYGPAFVGFLGGGGFGFGVGFGVGWFPLGYGEIYHPWYRYHAGGAYIRNINIHNTYIRNVNNINNVHNNYAYAHNAAAVTTTTHNGFVNGQAIHRGASQVNAASLRNTQVTNRVAATPTRASYTGAANARGNVARPSASVQNRPVVARTAPAAAASHMAVRTVAAPAGRNTAYTSNRSSVNAGNNSYGNARAQQLSSNRPPSAQLNSRNNGTVNNGSQRGNAANGYNYGSTNNSARAQYNRPNYGNSNSSVNSQGAARYNNNRPPSANTGRNYNQQSSPRTYSAPERGYSAPSRGYSAPSAPSRTYSAPSAPSRSAPAPSRGPSGGGGGSRPSGGGGSSPHGGGGGGSSSHGSHR